MSQELISKLNQLDQDLELLFQGLAEYQYQDLNKPPAPGKWSATQVMHHLMLAESLSLKYCQKKLSFQPILKKAGFLAFIRKIVLESYLRTPLKWKAPKGLETPFLPAEDSLDNVMEQWRTQRSQLKQFIEQLPAQYLDKEVYKHPFGGRLSWDGMLDFFDAHFKHHLPQIKRASHAV